jgi:hypothetical protein
MRSGGDDPTLSNGPYSPLRIGPQIAFAALTALTILIALREGSLAIVIAPLASSCVFAFGLATRESDVILLAWLDQGTNLTLLEAESTAGSFLVIGGSIVAVLVLADVAYMAGQSAPFGAVQASRQFRHHVPRLVGVGAASFLFALAGLALAPALTAPAYPELVVAILAVGALLAIVFVGSADR